MDIFKLIFEHDIAYDSSSYGDETLRGKGTKTSLEEFMKPMPTYVKYYLTGTVLGEKPQFGMSALKQFPELLWALDNAFENQEVADRQGLVSSPLSARLARAEAHELILIGDGAGRQLTGNLQLDERTGVREKLDRLLPVLDHGYKAIFTEKAHHGIDLHLFSRENLYESLFNAFKPLTAKVDFRYFSINGKKVGSERTFYFETWTLDHPPHGFEEVTPQAVLR